MNHAAGSRVISRWCEALALTLQHEDHERAEWFMDWAYEFHVHAEHLEEQAQSGESRLVAK